MAPLQARRLEILDIDHEPIEQGRTNSSMPLSLGPGKSKAEQVTHLASIPLHAGHSSGSTVNHREGGRATSGDLPVRMTDACLSRHRV